MADREETTGTTRSRTGTRKSAEAGQGGRKANSGAGGASTTKTPSSKKEENLRKDLRDFASARPEGWNHEDWLDFLESLQSRGHDIADREAIGLALEKERLDLALSRVRGVGPQRRTALIEKFGTIWGLRNADPADIAQTGNMPRSLAEKVKEELQ